LEVHLIHLNYDVFTTYYLTVQPLLQLLPQTIIFESTISGLIYAPLGGSFVKNINNFSSLNVGLYNYNLVYTINNISTYINIPINIIKKELSLNLVVQTKEYDYTISAYIYCIDISNIIINGQFCDPNVGIKDIIINNIILPSYLTLNYYTNVKNLKGIITPKIISPTIVSYDKEYDNTTSAILEFTVNIDSTLLKIISYDANFISNNIGLHDIIINNIIMIGSNNFILISDNFKSSANIFKKSIYAIFTANDKTYDKTNICDVVLQKLVGVIKTRLIIKSISAIFIDPNVGISKVVEISNYEICGLNSINYTLKFDTILANINPLKISLPIIINNKIYDSTTSAFITFNGDIKVLSYNANYINKNVNKNKIVNITNIILEDNNYIMDDCIVYSGILPKLIEFNFIGNDKIYDGTNICNGEYKINSYLNDNMSCTYDAIFEDNLIIINNLILLGKDYNNYKINSIKTNLPIITKKELTIVFNCFDKMYDKNLIAYGQINKIIGNIIGDEIIIISYNSNFIDYNTGFNKIVNITNIKLNNNNYFINNTVASGNIIQREITLTLNNNIISKEYDNEPDIVLEVSSITNILLDDNVYLESYISTFENNDVEIDGIINIENIILNGKSAHNYICNNFCTQGNITYKYIDISFSAIDLYYDIKLQPILTYTKYNDLFYISSYDACYLNIDIGEQIILISNITLSGITSNNYIVFDQNITGKILPKHISLNIEAIDKIYDETTNVSIINNNLMLSHFNAKFENKNVGIDKIVYITDISLNNPQYITDTTMIIYANIIPIELFIKPQINKIYDSTIFGVFDNLIINYMNNKITISSYICEYDDHNIGNNKRIYISKILLDNLNYNVKDFITYGIIDPIIINPIFTLSNKIYDGNNSAIVLQTDCSNNIISYNAYYQNINTVADNIVYIDNIIFKESYYKANNISLIGTINKKLLDINFTVLSKMYDKIKIATIDSYTILNSNEKINIISYSAYYDEIEVGNHLISITDIVIDSDNYYTTTYTTDGTIMPLFLDVKFTNLDKDYDKTINTNLKVLSIKNIIFEDIVTISSFHSQYDNLNANVDININITNIILSGINSNNYYVNDHIIQGDISPKQINCSFYYVDNIITSSLNGVLSNDKIWINNYISYKQNNIDYIQNISLDGDDKNNYSLLNINYKVT
jgi:hypothetical protein